MPEVTFPLTTRFPGNYADQPIGLLGQRYGYVYHPMRFPSEGWQVPTGLFPDGKELPWFDRPEDAEAFLRAEGWDGEVLSYCLQPEAWDAGATSSYWLGGSPPTEFKHPWRPWITAGVVSMVRIHRVGCSYCAELMPEKDAHRTPCGPMHERCVYDHRQECGYCNAELAGG